MQQKTRFIILIILICFVSLVLLSTKVWSANNQPAGGGGGSCTKVCKTMWYYDDPYTAINPQRHYYCKEYYPLPPECTGSDTTKEKEKREWDCYVCSGSKCVIKTFTKKCQDECKPWTTPPDCASPTPPPPAQYSCYQCRGTTCSVRYSSTPCSSTCRTNADCSPPPVSPPPVSPPPTTVKYSCNTSTWTCEGKSYGVYSSLSVCEANCVKPLTPPPPVSPPPVSPPPVSPPPTLPQTEPCMINYFELPERAWVGYPITGRWSASAYCEDCDVDCTSYPECVWKLNNIGIGNIGANEYKFTLSQSGTYDYTLTCYGEGGIDQRTETATVEAINLPWWREIIPVLP